MSHDHKAKLATLDNIIGIMDKHMLSRAKPRKAPEAPVQEAAAPEAPAEENKDDMDDDSARKLMDLYGSEQ